MTTYFFDDEGYCVYCVAKTPLPRTSYLVLFLDLISKNSYFKYDFVPLSRTFQNLSRVMLMLGMLGMWVMLDDSELCPQKVCLAQEKKLKKGNEFKVCQRSGLITEFWRERGSCNEEHKETL